MNWITGVIVVIAVVIGINIAAEYQRQQLVLEATTRFSQSFQKISIETAENSRRRLEEARAAELVAVNVKGKNIRKCMAELKTDVISDNVVLCSRDHVVSMRRDQVNAFMETVNQ